MSSPLVLDGVSVRFGTRTVLSDVDLQAHRGELLGLIGPNGAGKTTLLRTALGLLRPTVGRVLVDGAPARPRRNAIGYVPQRHDVAWDFPLTVADAVMTGRSGTLGVLRRPGAGDWQDVAEAMARVGLTDLADRPIGALSGGQRQRVLVARALALRPSLLLLDEPFTGLDLPTQDLLSHLFADLAHEDRAVVMTTHDIPSALVTCDRIALLARTVVAVDTPTALAGDLAVWQSAFGVGPDSALLRILKAV